MSTASFIYWQMEDAWLGYLDEFPGHQTQGKSLEELCAHLKDLHHDLTSGVIPSVRRRADLVIG